MKMIGKLMTAACAAGIIVSLASCQGGAAQTTTAASLTTTTTAAAAEPAKADFTPKDVTDAVLDAIPINSAFSQGKDNMSANFDTMKTDTIADYSYVVCASGAFPDEIAVFKFDSSDSAAAAKSAVEERLAYQKSVYEDYTPDEFYKLENAVIEQSGEYVYYLVTSDNEAAKKIVKGFIG